MIHKLDKKELKRLSEYWKFISIFIPTPKLYSPYEYRRNIINNVRKLYTADDFYIYEKMLNKLLWNLLFKLNVNINNFDVFDKKLFIIENILHGSYRHKIYIDDNKNKKSYVFLYYKELVKYEILQKIFLIMCDKNLYDKVMKNPRFILQIKSVSPYYYPIDYPFPNVNFLFYNKNNKSIWIDRIKKLYYNGMENNNINDGWYDIN
jgi:hypothetical protein